jgi:hypothetical protein
MKDWALLLHTRAFRTFWLALLVNNLASWSVIAALPILIAGRFGAGMALVLSLGLRVIPKVILAPLAGALLQRYGPARLASLAMLGQAVLTAALPWAETLPELQILVAAIGTLDLFAMPGLLSLRAPVTPQGHEMAGNTLCSVADRSAKIAGPALGGLLVAAGTAPAFLIFGALTAAAALTVGRLPSPTRTRRSQSGSLRLFVRMLTTDRQILGLFIAALTYMVMLGGLRPFLFWANRDWFHGSDTAWTGLLAAQGAGALIGALVTAVSLNRLRRLCSAYTLTLAAGILEGLAHLLLLFPTTALQAMLILALAGIPEIVSTAAWFTAAQIRLPTDRQAILFTYSAPLWDLAYAAGTFSGGLHADGMLSLSAYWALVSLTATLPLGPLLLARQGRDPSA